MADALGDYVRQMLQAGYPPEHVREQLVHAGYDAATVDAALGGAGVSRRKTLSIKPVMVAAILGGIIVLAVAGILIAGALAPKAQVIELSGRAATQQAVLGKTASFTTRVVNPSGAKATVDLAGELVENATGTVIARKSQQLSLRDTASPLVRFDVPEDAAPGAYHARITASWDGKSTSFSAGILLVAPSDVAEVPTEEEALTECPEGCDDLNQCTTDACSQGRCVHEAMTPCCGNRACEAGETALTCLADCRPRAAGERPAYELRADAEQAALEDPAKAEGFCGQIAVTGKADECYAAIAPSTGVGTCDLIADPDVKDSCIIDFAANDPSLCDRILDRTLRTSCQALARAKSIPPEETA
jgi:hypothetical protein